MPALPVPVHVDIDGVSVATYTLGPKSSPAGDVVLCHGTPWSAHVWASAARHLSRRFRVFLWDMPGYGRSDMRASVPVDLRHQMDVFSGLLEHWDLESPSVVAHDIGGAVALGTHLHHRRDFSRLFLWDAVTLTPWGSPFFRLVAENEHVFAHLPPDLHGALAEEYIAGAAHHRLPRALVRELAAPWRGRHGQAGFYRQMARVDQTDTEPLVRRLADVRCPVAVGWGADDPWVPFEQAGRLRDALPGDSPVVVLAGVGHLAPLEDPESVETALDAWLAGQR
ncbi:alpha/beta hydrolase [Kocuria polaris]|nr:alpha/beta hydrolase [Kocuria polaris]